MLYGYDIGYKKPQLNGKFTGGIDFKTEDMLRCKNILEYGISLINKYKAWPNYLPNPEKYDYNDKFYVERTNGLFVAAITFTLYHELGHQYYGHTQDDYISTDSKNDEITADNFAIEKCLKQRGTELEQTIYAGMIISIISLCLLDSELDGGTTHPNTEDRLQNLFDKINIESESDLWGLASFGLLIWNQLYNKGLSFKNVYDTPKDYYLDVLKIVKTNVGH